MRRRVIVVPVVSGALVALFSSLAFSVIMGTSTEAAADATPPRDLAAIAKSLESLMPTPVLAAAAPTNADGVGLVDVATGVWHLRSRNGDPTSFWYGDPGDFPMMGDWDCDGIDTPGLYRQSDGYVYLRNENTQGIADILFFFGNPGDIPLAGDFNGDGCDTVSIYRPSEARIYVINVLGSADAGLGAAEYAYYFGNPGDKPFVGDFNGDGIDTVGLHRESSGFMYFRNTNTTGVAHYEFYFGNPGDRLIAGNWLGVGEDYPAVFRPGNRTVYMRYTNTQGNADEFYQWGESGYVPVAGNFGALSSRLTVNVSGAPEGLSYAVESFYMDQKSAPHIPSGLRGTLSGLNDTPNAKMITGTANTATAYGKGVGVVQTNGDTLLAVTDNGWEWRIVGANPASLGRTMWYGDSPRFVTLIGADWQSTDGGTNWPSTPLITNADSVHIYAVNAPAGAGAIVGFPRDTLLRASFGEVKASKTMEGHGPAFTVGALRTETGLPIEGYLHTGMGSGIGGGNPPPGFHDLVDAFGGFPFLVPYSAGSATEGDLFVNGSAALAVGRERMTLAHGDVDRTLGQGLLIKAALATIKPLGILEMPNLLSIMDGFVSTDLSIDDLVTLAATVYTVDPGPMPTLTGPQLSAAGHVSGSTITSSHGPYNQNEGTLPNVMIKGCWQAPSSWKLQPNNYATFADLADGILSSTPWACP